MADPRKPRHVPARLRESRLRQLSEVRLILEQLTALKVPSTRLAPIQKYARRLERSLS